MQQPAQIQKKQSTNFLQVSPRKIENLIRSGGVISAGGWDLRVSTQKGGRERHWKLNGTFTNKNTTLWPSCELFARKICEDEGRTCPMYPGF